MGIRLGIISDAHGNGPALEACLTFFRKQAVDRVLFLGDAVGYFPLSTDVCEQLMRAEALCLKGNHEAMLFGELPISPEAEAVVQLATTAQNLPKDWRQEVEANGSKHLLEIGGRRFLLVHGSPDNPLTKRMHDPENCPVDSGLDGIFMGHTHRPFLHHKDGCLLLNPGSCGLPRDHGELLSLAVLEVESMHAQIFRIPFVHDMTLVKQTHVNVQQCLAQRCDTPLGTVWSKAI